MVDRALEDIDAAIQEAENDVRNATRHSAHTAFKWHLDNLKRFRIEQKRKADRDEG